MKFKLKQKQLEKVAEQFRLLSWGQGAIFTQLHISFTYVIIVFIGCFWVLLQAIAMFLERNSND